MLIRLLFLTAILSLSFPACGAFAENPAQEAQSPTDRADRQKMVEDHLQKAKVLYEAGDVQGAIREYDSILAVDPSNSEAAFGILVLRSLTGPPPAAAPPAPTEIPAAEPQPVPSKPETPTEPVTIEPEPTPVKPESIGPPDAGPPGVAPKAAEEASKPEEGSAAPSPEQVAPESAEKAIQATEEQTRPAASDAAQEAQVIPGRSRLQLELTETYAHFSSNQLFFEGFAIVPIVVVGNVTVERIRRDLFISTLTTRYRLTSNFQIEFRVPYIYVISRSSKAAGIQQNQTAQQSEETVASNSGLGDVEGSLSYQLLKERVSWPALLIGVGAKARTGRDVYATKSVLEDPPIGSGYNSLIGTLSFVKTADPGIVFGSLGYVYAMPRSEVVIHPSEGPPRLIDVSAGDSVRMGLGMAYALNYRLTLSFQYSQAITFPTKIDGKKVPNSLGNSISLRTGSVWRFTESTSIDIGVSIGLSLDAPDVRLDVRVPFGF